MKEDRIYMFRKIFTMITCIAIIVTVGLTIINFQSKSVTIDYYGRVIEIKTMSNTVEGLLMQNDIYIDEAAVVYPSVDSRLEENMQIKIYAEEEVALLDIDSYVEVASNNVYETIVEETSLIDYETQQKSNASKNRGTKTVLQKGEKGEKVTVSVVTYEGEKQLAKTTLSETVTKEAVSQVVEVGTKVVKTSRGKAYTPTAKELTVDSGFKKYKIKLSEDKQKYTYNMCKKYGVDYELMLALMYVESGYNANAKGSGGSAGLCQIMPANLSYLKKKIGTTNLYDPYQNIKAGTYWLSRYLKSWSDEASGETLELHALNSYNWGEGGYRNYLKKGHNASSWYYGKKIVSIKNKLISNGGL